MTMTEQAKKMENKADKDVMLFLVEDDDVDAMAVTRALKQLKILNPVVRARDGVEALEMLRAENVVRKPFVILLDINMPRMNGFEFMEVVRQDPALSSSVIFVLTTSESDQDKFAAYQKHVAGYIVKQRMEEGLLDIIKMLNLYWKVVQLPH